VRNFGSPSLEGYRKALRVMQLAAKFADRFLTLIDTPGLIRESMRKNACQAKRYRANLREWSRLRVPVIVTLRRGRLRRGARQLRSAIVSSILENSFYSVFRRGVRSIIWRDSRKRILPPQP